MTDKQIIIDYKNLCENYSEEVGCYNTFDGSCIQEQCFTYKLLQQLQSKEQECETLASQLDFEVQKKECLEQECEELKKENQNLKNMYNSMSDLCEIKDEAILDKNADIEELSQHCFEYSDRIHNFKQALDEIEIYCKTAKGVATNKNDIEFFKMIIDIINKAKVEEDKQ